MITNDDANEIIERLKRARHLGEHNQEIIDLEDAINCVEAQREHGG